MLEERNIQLTQFLTSRASEIKNFTQSLESKYLNSNKFPYQIIHKHLRRRAMSHNRYRIPRLLRKQMNETGLLENENQQKIVKCRKHIRKVKLLQSSYQRRSRQVQWLETHLHQTKRMKMVEYCGFKVALKANEKNWRAVHRFEQHGCCIYDTSYYTTICVQGAAEDIISFIKSSTHSDTLDQKFVEGRAMIECLAYDEQSKILGPVSFLIKPNEPTNMMMFVHPALEAEILAQLTLRQLQVCVRRGELSIFQLQGPQSQYQVQELLKVLAYNSEGPPSDPNCGEAISYHNFNLKSAMKVQQNGHEYKQVKTLNDYASSNMQISIPRSITQQTPQQSSPNIWNFNITDQDKQYSKRFHTIVRARYTHRKKQKLEFQLLLKEKKKTQHNERLQKIQDDKELKKAGVVVVQKEPELVVKVEIPEDQGKKAIRWHLHETIKLQNKENEILEEVQYTKLMANKDVQKELTLMIIQEQHESISQFSQGIKLVVNLGQGLFIWKLLHKLKLKPIGLRDSRQLALENGVRFYPDDYPHTLAYQIQSQKNFIESVVKTAKAPPAIRWNHFDLLFPCPFKPLWDLLNTPTTPVFMQAYQGVPQFSAIIVRPSLEDMNCLLEGAFTVPVRHTEQSFAPIKNDGRTLAQLQQYESYVSQLKLDRELIGFVTSGNFSNKFGKAVAITHIKRELRVVEELIVLYRNPGSKLYYFASCKFI